MQLFRTLQEYKIKNLRYDFFSALAVLFVLVPQGLAYSLLAGFPPEAGLYTGLISLLIYPIFASSRFLSVGPVALSSIILYNGLQGMTEVGSQQYIQLGLLVCFMAGIIQLLLAIFRLGILVNFLSNPVISGFISGAAIIIIIKTSFSMLGLSINSDTFFDISQWSVRPWDLGIGLFSFIFLILWRRKVKKIPGVMVLFVLVSLFSYGLYYGFKPQINIVGEIPKGLPRLQFYPINYMLFMKLLPLALVIALISFIDSSAIAKRLNTGLEYHILKPNKELLGLGLAKVIGSFFMNIPSSGSFARSAINKRVGSKTQVHSLLAAILLLLCIISLAPLFYYVPRAMLSALIVVSVMRLIDIQHIIRLWSWDKRDFLALMGCFLVTVFIGIQEGIVTGISISLGLILWKNMRPHYAVLGKLVDQNVYRNIDRYSETETSDDRIIFRFDDDLYFANAEYFYSSVNQEISKKEKIKYLIMDFSSVSHIDSTGIDTMKLLSMKLKDRGIIWKLSGLKGPVRDLMLKYGYDKIISPENCYLSIDLALASCDEGPPTQMIN